MQRIIEVAAARADGRIPLGIMTLRQALQMPQTHDFIYRHLTEEGQPEKVISRQELETLARN